MNVELITKEPAGIRKQAVNRNQKLVPIGGQGASKKWLKSNEVRQLLKISPGT
jgi:hypothetical protein